jgi:hypothetical protein
MAKPHACETFDFPLAAGVVNYSVTKKISKKGGGTWQIAEQEAIDEARQQGDTSGKTALKNETCAAPCDCFIFVDVSIDGITPVWAAGKKGKVLDITITGTWEAGILCFKHEEKSKDGKSGSDDKEKGKGKKSASDSREKSKHKDGKSASDSRKKSKHKSDKPSSGDASKSRNKAAPSAPDDKQKNKGKSARSASAGQKKAGSKDD